MKMRFEVHTARENQARAVIYGELSHKYFATKYSTGGLPKDSQQAAFCYKKNSIVRYNQIKHNPQRCHFDDSAIALEIQYPQLENHRTKNRENNMEQLHTDNLTALNIETREAPRKAWHAPAVRWLDVRETQHGFGGFSDGGSSGSSLS